MVLVKLQIIFVLNVQLLLMTFWFIGRCGEVWCVGEYCCRMAVDDDGELERKSVALRFLLGIEEGGYFKDVYHVEERVTEYSNMMFDPNFEGGGGRGTLRILTLTTGLQTILIMDYTFKNFKQNFYCATRL